MRFFEALLPLAELAAEQCRKLAEVPTAGPLDKPAVKPVVKRSKPPGEREPENPLPLGVPICRMHVEALRPEERAALRFIREYGPMTVARFKREHKLPKAMRERVLRDLDRFGLIAGYSDGNGWTIIHATEKAEPLFECNPDESFNVTLAVRAKDRAKWEAERKTGPSGE